MQLTPHDWARITGIFDVVRELPPADREARLLALTAGDAALQQEVESLLSADADDAFLAPAIERAFDAFSADILRYLRGMPVQARPDTLGYRAQKFVKRQRALVVSASVAVLALVGATLFSIRAARLAQAETDRAQRTVSFLQTVLGAGDASFYSGVSGSKDITLRDLLDSTARHIPGAFANDPHTRADLYTALGRSQRRFNQYSTALVLLDSATRLHQQSVGDISGEVAEDLTITALIQTEIGKNGTASTLLRGALARFVLPSVDQLREALLPAPRSATESEAELILAVAR